MSILAEPRRKQRISVDPQNVGWRTSSSSIGKKLMTKMNWKEGKGLGKNEQGESENLKLNANYSGKGLGCDRETKSKNQWISHHDDFASLLANLNSSNKSTSSGNNQTAESIQSRSRSSKARVHYKFTRGKDLTLATQEQKQAIFGGVKKEIRKEKKAKVVVEPENDESEEGTASKMMTVSTVSVSDYYKEKMAKWSSKKSVEQTNEEGFVEIEGKPKSKKRQRFDDETKVTKKSKKF